MKKPLVSNAADTKQIKEATEREKLQEKQESKDYRVALGTPEGRRVFWNILCEAGMFQDCSETSALSAYRFLGKRSMGLYIVKEIKEHCPDLYRVMEDEQLKGGQRG